MASLVKFKRKVRKGGRSLVVTIPMELLEAVGLEDGTPVLLYLNEQRQIIVEKADMGSELMTPLRLPPLPQPKN